MNAFHESASVITATAEQCGSDIERAAQLCIDVIKAGGKLLICGNGGSAAEAQHMTAELVVRLRSDNDRPAIPAICLNADTAVLTACANDYGYERVFARQVEALARQGDVLVCLSTSGDSDNIIKACWEAAGSDFDVSIIAITGQGAGRRTGAIGGDIRPLGDVHITIPSTDTARIQEATLVVIHELCRMTEEGCMKNLTTKSR